MGKNDTTINDTLREKYSSLENTKDTLIDTQYYNDETSNSSTDNRIFKVHNVKSYSSTSNNRKTHIHNNCKYNSFNKPINALNNVHSNTENNLYTYARNYSILRIGRKYYGLDSIKGFKAHMEREMNVLNANNEKNYILIGDGDIYNNATKYLENAKIRKNNVIARELLLTASPGFFINKSNAEIDNWVTLNMQFLKEKFGDNCIYATIHFDEHSPHIHALIIPKFYKEKTDSYYLSNSYYFDGKVKLSKIQDEYYECISKEFKDIQRGMVKAKATHKEIQNFYSLICSPLDMDNQKQIIAKAKANTLLNKRILELENTLIVYKKTNDNLIKITKNQQLQIDDLKNENVNTKKTIEYMKCIYNIPVKKIKEIKEKIKHKEL